MDTYTYLIALLMVGVVCIVSGLFVIVTSAFADRPCWWLAVPFFFGGVICFTIVVYTLQTFPVVVHMVE